MLPAPAPEVRYFPWQSSGPCRRRVCTGPSGCCFVASGVLGSGSFCFPWRGAPCLRRFGSAYFPRRPPSHRQLVGLIKLHPCSPCSPRPARCAHADPLKPAVWARSFHRPSENRRAPLNSVELRLLTCVNILKTHLFRPLPQGHHQ